ncbi:antA/AntB antirepressor family protein [Vibrio sp. ER1A]|uniref:antA/AntB antirepressor family protein n=1 Tax=Vibrio sp. ER1A TaxID=1517681 RepID=UPI0006911779|nr:antA/AntB antirepressor family protein [Vibrio sp. ER1A]
MNTKKSLIQIEVFEAQLGNATATQRCVDARALHSAIEVGADFPTWINRKIEEFGFSENLDFSSAVGKSSGGRPATEYTISIDMAKELCMLERSEIGRATRKYFIESEEKLIQISSLSVNQTSTLAKDIAKYVNMRKAADNEFELQLYTDMIERLCFMLKMRQPLFDLLDKKLEKKAS